MRHARICLLSALLTSAGTAWSCGGSYTFSPSLHPAADSLVTDSFDGTDIAPFRFLDPFRLAGLYQADRLSQLAYGVAEGEEPATAPEPALTLPGRDDFDARLTAADRAGAKAAATVVVDGILSLATPLAQDLGDDLRRAVEYLEVEPALAQSDLPHLASFFATSTDKAASGGDLSPLLRDTAAIRAAPFDSAAETLARFPDSPRRPSLELAVLRNRIGSEIGNGWPGQIQDTSEATWNQLIADHDAWIGRYPSHPLADLARLQKLRLLYLRGNGPATWNLLLDLYPRRPGRALWEMRHLFRNGYAPTPADLDRIQDPVLVTALVHTLVEPQPAQWPKLWRLSEPAASQGAAWALNLQERLLYQIAEGKDATLPDAFPATAAKPSELWGQLRTLALIHAGRQRDALAQAALLDSVKNASSAAIAATARVDTGDIAGAVELGALDADTAVYLLQVMADAATLDGIMKGGGPRAAAAADALALRRLGTKGDWAQGARLLAGVSPQRAELWRQAAKRAQDQSPGGRLALAGWLMEHEGELFPPRGSETWRGLKALLDTPLGKTEHARLSAWLLRGGEREWALDAYGAALTGLDPGSTQARKTLAEADRLYNQILNWDYAQSERFAKLLAGTPAARGIRNAGKAIRARGDQAR